MQFTPGSYLAKLVGAVLGQTNGTPPAEQMVLTWSVTHQAVNGQWDSIEPTDRRMYLSFSGGAVPFTKAKLKSLGFNGNFDQPDFAPNVVNDGVEIIASENTYNGKTTLRWDLPGGGGEVEKAPANVIRARQAAWDRDEKPVQRPTPAKPAAPKPAARPAPAPAPQPEEPPQDDAPPPSGDSIPF